MICKQIFKCRFENKPTIIISSINYLIKCKEKQKCSYININLLITKN